GRIDEIVAGWNERAVGWFADDDHADRIQVRIARNRKEEGQGDIFRCCLLPVWRHWRIIHGLHFDVDDSLRETAEVTVLHVEYDDVGAVEVWIWEIDEDDVRRRAGHRSI